MQESDVVALWRRRKEAQMSPTHWGSQKKYWKNGNNNANYWVTQSKTMQSPHRKQGNWSGSHPQYIDKRGAKWETLKKQERRQPSGRILNAHCTAFGFCVISAVFSSMLMFIFILIDLNLEYFNGTGWRNVICLVFLFSTHIIHYPSSRKMSHKKWV